MNIVIGISYYLYYKKFILFFINEKLKLRYLNIIEWLLDMMN